MAAYRLGIAGEAARQLGSVAGHHATPRSALALCCVEAVNPLRDSTQSQIRNITLGATFSVLCAIAHKTDAATGEHGDLLDLISLNRGHTTLRETLEEARAFLNEPARLLPRPRQATPRDSSAAARRLFAASRPLSGCLAATYLRSRGITRPVRYSALRFHPACYYRADAKAPLETWPALIAAVTDLSGNITGVLRTWLAPDGRAKAPVADPRRAMGELLGNAVRFGAVLDVAAAGEGVETMLSLKSLLPELPMMAALSASHLAGLLLPPSLRRLYVAVDDDAAGHRAATLLKARACDANIDAHLLLSRNDDWNTDLRAFGSMRVLAHVAGQLARQDAERFVPPARL
jgi:hypothetical protein